MNKGDTMLFAETLSDIAPGKRSPLAQKAARTWQQKSHEITANGAGFGLLGGGVDFKLADKEQFFTSYLMHHKL